jgi:hypothetical protein
MRTRIEWEWEKLDKYTLRAKVFGGWLVLHAYPVTITDHKKRDMSQSESMVFVPDPNHQWTILSPPKEEPKKPSVADEF